MRSLRKLFVSLAFVGCVFGVQPARAGIPVIDVASLVQAILETLAWIQQAQDMIQQIENQAEQIQGIGRTVESLGNARNLGSILNDPNIQALMPDEIRNANQLLLNATAHSPDRLAAIEGALSAYGVQTSINGMDVRNVRGSADALGKMQKVLQSAQARNQQVTSLASRVDTSADAKDSMDMVNRNVIEQTRATGDLTQTIATIEATKQAETLQAIAASQQRLASFRQRAQQSAAAQGH